MSEHVRFHLKDLPALRAELERLNLSLPVCEDVRNLGDRVPLGRLTCQNRFVAQPMEGFDSARDGGPTELTYRRYGRYAAGGTALLWFEATAVVPEARSNPRQLYLHRGNAAEFGRLVRETRRIAREAWGWEPVCVIQLTHSGRYSKPGGIPKPIIAHHSPVLDPKHHLPPDYPLISDEDLDRLQEVYVAAARLAEEAGFDGVDVKSCHRYLVSELLASFTRPGRYGGSYENRTRFLRETLGRIAAAVPGVFVTTRMNAYDAIEHPYGFGVSEGDLRIPDLRDPIRLAGDLRALGTPLLNVSIGNPYFNPHYGRPFDFPIKGMPVPPEHPLEAIVRFARITREIQQSVPGLPVVASGYTWLRHLMPPVAAGVVQTGGAMLVGQGRGMFAYPDSVRDILKDGRMDPAKCCVACSACTQIMRDGGMTGCVVRDSAIYGPQYRLARRFSLDRLSAEAQRCRSCEDPTCARACPAHVDVPAFVSAFAVGDYRKAYDILRQSNALPEMCAHVCPADVQCEGGCVENIFCEHPVAIADIQLEVCRIARREGYAGVRLPAETRSGRIAVIGGGPAGLACAIRLLESGYAVALYEKGAILGGTPDAMIPADRLDDAGEEIRAILAPALTAGRLRVEAGRALGPELSVAQLRREHEAVFVAVGLGDAPTLGRGPGVWDALTFLRQAKAGALRALPSAVAVIGGGNTAMDAACTARRLGAADVYVVYRRSLAEMPAWPAERRKAEELGVHMLILTQPDGYETDAAGNVCGVRITRTELGTPDDSGRRRPLAVAGSESVLRAQAVIEAIGQTIPADVRQALDGIALTRDGRVKVTPGSAATSMDGVFAGGDVANGGTTAVQGVSEGIRAAEEIDRRLRALSR